MNNATPPLGEFARDHVLLSWDSGFASAAAVRAWMRAPSEVVLDDPEAQEAYKKGLDPDGGEMLERARGILLFLAKAELGPVAVRVTGDALYFIVRDTRHRTWLALLEEFGYGITVYSRWAEIATISFEHAPSEAVFAEVIRRAQHHSARRPAAAPPRPDGRVRGDWVDPEHPTIMTEDGEQAVRPPDLWDRVMTWLKNFV